MRRIKFIESALRQVDDFSIYAKKIMNLSRFSSMYAASEWRDDNNNNNVSIW